MIVNAEVTVRDGRRWAEVMCKCPGCAAYGRPRLYDEDKFTIQALGAANVTVIRGAR